MRNAIFVIGLICLQTVVARCDDRDHAAHIVFVIGEREYKTSATLQQFFEKDLAPRGFTATFIVAKDSGPGRHQFSGLPKALKSADLLFLSTRRRAPRADELKAIADHLDSGKPMVAIRTACHAFDARGDFPDGHAEWVDFDEAVLGAKYTGHFGSETFRVDVPEGMSDHPMLTQVKIESSSKLYKIRTTAATAEMLLSGRRDNGEVEAVAWTNRFGQNNARVFYTSLGLESDFNSRDFRQLLLNAIRHSLELPVDSDDRVARTSRRPQPRSALSTEDTHLPVLIQPTQNK